MGEPQISQDNERQPLRPTHDNPATASSTSCLVALERGVMTLGKGSGALRAYVSAMKHKHEESQGRNATYGRVPLLYSPLGMISFPSASFALWILKTARVQAIVVKIRSIARCFPGHTLRKGKSKCNFLYNNVM